MDRRFFVALGIVFLIVTFVSILDHGGKGWDERQTGFSLANVDAAEGAIPSGEELFNIHGCSACHLVAGAGFTVGPNLKDVGKRLSEEEIKQSLLEPNAVITQGFLPNLMPPDLKTKLSEAELDALVKYLMGL